MIAQSRVKCYFLVDDKFLLQRGASMSIFHNLPIKFAQSRGIALLILMLIVLLLSTSLLLARLNHVDNQLARQEQTALVLARAKAALIGFAATYADDADHKGQPQGYLPCPDFNGDGSSANAGSTDASCSSAEKSVIGRLPWRTLGLPPLRDGNGDCLWYAVSGNYKDQQKRPLTSDDDGLFVIQDANGNMVAGTDATNRAIAVVFSPGKPLATQNRGHAGIATECGSETTVPAMDAANHVSNYLESLGGINNATGGGKFNYGTSSTGNSGFFATSNALEVATFVSAPETKDANGQVIFNDVLSIITPRDFEPVYRRMNEWVAERVTQCIANYAAKNLTDFLNNNQPVIGDWSNPAAGTYRATHSSKIDEYVARSKTYCKYSKCNTVVACKQSCVETEDECKSLCQDSTCEQLCTDDATSCQTDCGTSMATCETKCDSSPNADNYKKNAINVNSTYPWATTRVDTVNSPSLSDDYADENNVRFGRIPLVLGQTSVTNQYMKSSWGSLDSKLCFDEGVRGTPDNLGDYEWGWWEQWKELVFYAVDDNYAPSKGTYFWVKTQSNAVKNGNKWEIDSTTSSYTKASTLAKIDATVPDGWSPAIETAGSSVLKLGNDAANFLILISGRKLATQPNRDNKLNLDNYLELENKTPTDNKFERGSLIDSFNDIACKNTKADCKKIPQGDNL